MTDRDWRAHLAPLDHHNEKAALILLAVIAAWRDLPESYLDLGSGTGAMVNLSRKLGVDAYGVDLQNGPEHWFITHDLTRPLFLLRVPDWNLPVFVSYEEYALLTDEERERQQARFPLITCLEVAEHLPEAAAHVLCDTIARHLAPGGRLIFSAAPPGQHGEGHIHLKSAPYWRTMFYERGLSYQDAETRQLSHLWAYTAGPAAHWLAANVQVFDTA